MKKPRRHVCVHVIERLVRCCANLPAAVVANALLIGIYMALNAGLNFANRWALGVHGFSFPLVLTAAHMLLNPVFLLPLMMHRAYRLEHSRLVLENWRGLLGIAALNAVQISLNNSSLVHIELSMNQVVRATMPVFVALLQWMRGDRPSRAQFAVLVLLTVGVVLVVYQPAVVAEWFGVTLVASSVGLQAAQMSFAGSLLSSKLDSFQMTFYTGPPAFAILFLPALYYEGSRFATYAAGQPATVLTVVLGTCSLAVLYNVVVFQTIHRMSAVGSAVLGNVKVVALLFLSSLLMGEMRSWSATQFVGCALTLLAAGAYSALKLGFARLLERRTSRNALLDSMPWRLRVLWGRKSPSSVEAF